MDQLQSSSMRVFLTGHKGKIGTSIHRLLLKEGHEIVGFDILDGNDILDANAVERAMADCDSVIHLATLLGHDQNERSKIDQRGNRHLVRASGGRETSGSPRSLLQQRQRHGPLPG